MFFPDIYGSWEEKQKEKYEGIFRVLGDDFLSKLFKAKTLDIGYGVGFLKKFLESRSIPAKLYGVDTRPAPAEMFVLGDGGQMPFRDESFGFVVSIDTMHLIGSDDFRRVLENRGHALLGLFFNDDNRQERMKILHDKLRGFEIIAEFELRGMENEYVVLGRKRYC